MILCKLRAIETTRRQHHNRSTKFCHGNAGSRIKLRDDFSRIEVVALTCVIVGRYVLIEAEIHPLPVVVSHGAIAADNVGNDLFKITLVGIWQCFIRQCYRHGIAAGRAVLCCYHILHRLGEVLCLRCRGRNRGEFRQDNLRHEGHRCASRNTQRYASSRLVDSSRIAAVFKREDTASRGCRRSGDRYRIVIRIAIRRSDRITVFSHLQHCRFCRNRRKFGNLDLRLRNGQICCIGDLDCNVITIDHTNRITDFVGQDIVFRRNLCGDRYLVCCFQFILGIVDHKVYRLGF